MLKECYNQRASSDEFIKLFEKDENKIQIYDQLMDICCMGIEPSELFLDYVIEIVKKNPKIIINYLDNVENSNTSRFTAIKRIFNHKNGLILNYLEVGTKEAAYFISKLLNIIVNDNLMDLILKLTNSLVFSALVSSIRYYYFDDLINIREKFKINCYLMNVFQNSFSFPASLLHKALFDEPQLEQVLFPTTNMIQFVLPNICMKNSPPLALKFLDENHFYYFYTKLLNSFIDIPTLLLGYNITCLIPRALAMLENGIDPTSHLYFDKNIFDNFYSRFAHYYKMNYLEYETELLFDQDQINEFGTMFSYVPSSYDIENIFDLCNQYPTLTCLVVDAVINAYDEKNSHLMQVYTKKILDNHIDFISVVIQQGKYFNLLHSMYNLLPELQDINLFNNLWILCLTLVRDVYSIGWQSLNEEIDAFFDNYSDRNITLIYKIMTHKPFNIDELPTSSDTLLNDILSSYRIMSKENILHYLDLTEQKPYIWSIVLLYGINNNIPELSKIIKCFPKSNVINNFLFHHLMVETNKPPLAWRVSIEDPDICFIMRNPPESLHSLKGYISKTLESLILCENINLWYIVCTWRSYSLYFGTQKFIKILVEQLIIKTSTVLIPNDTLVLFQNTAYILIIICSEEENMAKEIEETVEGFLDNELENITVADAMARLNLIIICGGITDWEPSFNRVLSKCISILQSPEHSRIKITYSLSFILLSLSNKILREKIGNDVLQALVKIGAWKNVVDYFMFKSINKVNKSLKQ